MSCDSLTNFIMPLKNNVFDSRYIESILRNLFQIIQTLPPSNVFSSIQCSEDTKNLFHIGYFYQSIIWTFLYFLISIFLSSACFK